MTGEPGQLTLTEPRNPLFLIPPLADEFSLYGGDDTVARARAWALDHRYLLAENVPSCAHGLYLLSSCPGSCREFAQLDHARLWVPASAFGKHEEPFVLSHPYSDQIEDDTRGYAKAHGLQVGSFPEFGDDWYGSGAIPIRLTIPPDWPLWPIDALATVLLDTQPVRWPE